jgi:5-methyltetrahydrofolate--homocysteine methyltransferase
MVPCDKILAAAPERRRRDRALRPDHPLARRDGARRQGDEARTGCTVPLLIGGATTSAAHTAVKIAPEYPRRRPRARRLAGRQRRQLAPFAGEQAGVHGRRDAAKQEKQREEFAARRAASRSCPLEGAGPPPEGSTGPRRHPPPDFLGTRLFRRAALRDRPVHRLGPVLQRVGAPRPLPDILTDAVVGTEATKLYDDARGLLAGSWPRSASRPTPSSDSGPATPSATTSRSMPTRAAVPWQPFHMLRQQQEKPADQFNHCLADYIAPKESGRHRLHRRLRRDGRPRRRGIRGPGFRAASRRLQRDHGQALGDRLAEAMAEMFHKKAREACGFGRTENLGIAEMIRERYRGIRPPRAIPPAPTIRRSPFLRAAGRRPQPASRLTESCAMTPGEQRERLVFQPPGLQVLRRRKARPRPGRRLRSAQGLARRRGREMARAVSRLRR